MFNLGSGFVGMNMTGFHLAQIKKGIKEVDHKVSVGLAQHFKNATSDFEEALDMIQCKMYTQANTKLERVIFEARQAFSIKEGLDEGKERVPLVSYRELMNSARMLMFSKILVYSYDEKGMYLPHLAMPENKRICLEMQVEKLAKECIEKKNKVNVKKRQMKFIYLKKSTNLTRKSEVQDRLDRILKIAYPYVSQLNGWTDAGTEITIEDEQVDIRVNPIFVPLGEEDEVRVAVGVLLDEDGEYPGFVYVWIWKEENELFIQHGGVKTVISLLDYDEISGAIDVACDLDTDHLMESGQEFYGEDDDDSATDDDDYEYDENDDEDEEDDN